MDDNLLPNSVSQKIWQDIRSLIEAMQRIDSKLNELNERMDKYQDILHMTGLFDQYAQKLLKYKYDEQGNLREPSI